MTDVALAMVLTVLVGCPFAGRPPGVLFPESVLVPVAPGTTVETTLGAGAPSLANSTWALYRADDDTLLFRIAFGPGGEVERLFDSFVFAKEWLGSKIIPDTQSHPTDFPGGSYVSGAYAAQQDGSVGVLGILHGGLSRAHLGTATLSFSGTVEDDRIDGMMARTVTIFAATPFPPPDDAEFQAYALREP